jgi:hypothetical protein
MVYDTSVPPTAHSLPKHGEGGAHQVRNVRSKTLSIGCGVTQYEAWEAGEGNLPARPPRHSDGLDRFVTWGCGKRGGGCVSW